MATLACRAVVIFCIPMVLGAAAQARAAVPFLNANCPGGVEVHADAGGPVYVSGREASLKRFNDHYYEARDTQSGITVSISGTDDQPQVSYTGRNGANGICQVGQASAADRTRAQPPRESRGVNRDGSTEVTCESNDRKQVECDMDTRGEVRVIRQLSRTDCREGDTWGLSRHSVWVKNGCRAVFRNVSKAQNAPRATMAGDTALGACNTRKGANGALVTQMPVGKDYNELIIDYPDGRFLCMLRNDGWVQSLVHMRGR